MANEFKHKAVGTILTQGEFEATDSHVFNSQATGDIVYASSSSQLSRLAKGADNTILTLSSNIPAWTATPTLTSLTIGTGVFTDDVITFTPSASDTITMTAGTNGTFSLVTVDAAAAAANISIVADGTVDIDSAGILTLDSGAAINIEPAAGSAILLDGVWTFDGSVATPVATAHNVAGTAASISGGTTTAGTTSNIAGGTLTIAGGRGKGSGAGGDIVFQTANAAGSGSSLNALATALTISDDLSATFGGSIVMVPSASDTITIAGATNGALSITTVDAGGAAANLSLVADGTVDIDSAGALTLDSGAAINLEPASGSVILLDGILTVDAGVVVPVATAHNAAGTAISISAGTTTAGTTDNIAGGSLTLEGGRGKGSGAGGDIIFRTANAGGSGSSLNALATALTLSDDLSATFGGGVTFAQDVTMTAGKNVVLGDGSSVNISAPLLAGTDHTYSGTTAQMLAGGAISAFDLVCIHTVTGEVVEADASAAATSRVIGIAPAAISDTATGTVLLHGFIRDDTWGWTTGGVLFLSETAGAMTHTAPTTDGAFVQAVGIALEPDVVFINPSLDVIEHA